MDGSFNNLIPGQENFGAADLDFPVLGERDFPIAQNDTSYLSAQTVQDSTPRLASHLIVNRRPIIRQPLPPRRRKVERISVRTSPASTSISFPTPGLMRPSRLRPMLS